VGDRSEEMLTYLPASLVHAISAEPSLAVPWCRAVEGTMVMADLSGFTAISERLAKLGDEGAERLTAVINSFFERMLKTASFYVGDTLTFGGDAILLLFQGEGHADRGVAAALGMLKQVQRAAAVDAGDARVKIGMSVGAHSDSFLLAAVGLPETEVRALFLGRGSEQVALAEAQADRGQVTVSQATGKLIRARIRTAKAGEYRRVEEFDAKNVCPPMPDEIALSDRQAAFLAPFLPPYVYETPGASAPPHLQLTPEHRRVAIVFVNILGLNDLIERNGVGAALEQLQSYAAMLTLLSEKHHGFVVSSDIATRGSKLILTFGAPLAHEYAAANAARFALELNVWLRDAGLDIEHRIGVNGGHVFAGEIGPSFRRQYTVMGDAVNLAARLMAAAHSGEAYVSRDFLTQAGPSFCGRELPPMKVKGKEQPVSVCVLEEEKQAGRHVHLWAHSSRAWPRMFGRRTELRLIQEAWEGAQEGRGRTMLVVGEAGVGKTRLLEEALNGMTEAALTTRLACFEHLQAAPFAPWMQSLDSLLDLGRDEAAEERTDKVQAYLESRLASLVEFGSLLNPLLGLSLAQSEVVKSLDAQSRRQRLLELIADVVVAAGRDGGHVIVVEDLHWMDESSMALVGRLAEHATAASVLMLLTSRPLDVPSELSTDDTTRLDLAELARSESLAMVREALGVPDLPDEVGEAVYEKTKGNPLFLEEVIHSLQAPGTLERILTASSVMRAAELAALEIPDRVQGLLMSRIDGLPSDTREVLKIGSVVGRSFDQTLLVGIDDPLLYPSVLEHAIDELVDAGLVVVAGEDEWSSLTFRHALVQDVAYESMPFARRRELHRRVAHYLESVAGSDDHGLLVHHYQHADDAKMTRLHAVMASAGSVAVYASREAIDYLKIALATASAPTSCDACLRGRFEELIGDSLVLLGRHEEALTCFKEARHRWASPRVREIAENTLRELSPIEDPDARDSSLCWRIALAAERGEASFRRASRWLDRAMAALPPNRPGLKARVYITRSVVLSRLGRFREAVEVGEEALALARQDGDLPTQAWALSMLTMSLDSLGLLRRAVECNEEGIRLYEKAGDLAGLWSSHANLAAVYLKLGDVRKSLEHDEISLGLASRIGDVNGIATQHLNVGADLTQLGEARAAITHLEEAVSLRTQRGVGPGLIGFALALLAQAQLRVGDFEAAEQAIVEGRSMLESLNAQGMLLDVGIVEAELSLAEGRLEEAELTCKKVASSAKAMGVEASEAQALCMLGRVRVAQGRPHEAIPYLERCVTVAQQGEYAYEHAQALAVLAEAKAACAEDDESCEDLLFEAIRMFEKMGARYDLEKAFKLRERLAATA
jgi:class 3 adenylate cyclase/tetratricopeptide (TPR) repeat protein